MPEQHNRKTDDMTFPHDRISDPVLVDLLTTVKINNSKLDSVIVDVGEIKKTNELIKDRLVRVETKQGSIESGMNIISETVHDTRTTLISHAKDEEEILSSHTQKISKLEEHSEYIKRGFPKNTDGDRDPRSHADNHEADQTWRNSRVELWKEVKKWAVIGILSSVVGSFGYLLLTGAKVELKRELTTVESKK